MQPLRATSPLTARSLILGLGIVMVVSLGAPYSIWMVGSSEISWSFFPIGVGVPFIGLVLINAGLRRLSPGRALQPPELITIVMMGLVASGIPIFVAGYIIAVISKPYYGATPENDWEVLVQPFLPDWAVPSPDGHAMRYFYEGLPKGQPIPWGSWAGPLAWWLSFVLALYLVCFCCAVLLRRQWVEHERLVFPLTEVPRLLVEQDPEAALPPIFRSRSFWVGCAIPLSVILFNMVSFFEPGFPQIPVFSGAASLTLFDGTIPMVFLIYFPVVGFMYLVSTQISFSIWFFYLLTLAEGGLVYWAGLAVTRPDAYVWDWQTLAWQAWGAFAAMVLLSLWMARHHLRRVLRKTLAADNDLDDSGEMLSYRAATIALMAGLVYCLAFLWRLGMDLHVAALYLGGTLVVFLGITRLVVQSGLHYLTAPMQSQALTVAVTGTGFEPTNTVALALTYGCFGDVESIFMPSAAHAARLNELNTGKRGLAPAIGIAVVAAFIGSIWLIMYLCYQYGAGNFRSWFFQSGAGAGELAFDFAVRQIRDPWPTDWAKLAYFGLGSAAYFLLSLLQYRFLWWPLNPVGMTVATTWMVRRVAVSVFIAWFLKSVILRLGGIRLYRQLRPCFIGLIVGFYIGVGISYAVDATWFFGKGHGILHG
jgi:hypothetical protein